MRPPRRSTALGIVAFAFLLAALAALAACNGGGRFPTCKSDTECASRTGGEAAPHCFELRCVACRADGDCPAGSACNSANECKSIGGAGAAAAADAGAPEVFEKETWEPSTSEDRDRCIAACKGKGKDCLKGCGASPKKK
jgi:Cys-rich repeat protein